MCISKPGLRRHTSAGRQDDENIRMVRVPPRTRSTVVRIPTPIASTSTLPQYTTSAPSILRRSTSSASDDLVQIDLNKIRSEWRAPTDVDALLKMHKRLKLTIASKGRVQENAQRAQTETNQPQSILSKNRTALIGKELAQLRHRLRKCEAQGRHLGLNLADISDNVASSSGERHGAN